jgi:transcriptional regulator with XRE-family HTH domain
MTSWKLHRERLLADPRIREEYEALMPRFEAIRQLIQARAESGLTQAQLAERMGTKQNVISRLESAEHDPRLGTLTEAARAMGYDVEIRLKKRSGRRKRAALG